MDVDRRANRPEEQKSECRSLTNNYQYSSQSRKISIGVLVDSIAKAEIKDPKEPVMQIAEKEACSKGNSVKDRHGHTPLVEKCITVEQNDTSPWVSTRSFNLKISSSVAVQETEHTPSFPPTSRRRPRQKNSGKDICSIEAGKANNAEHVQNLVCSTEPGVQLEKEQAEDRDRTTETGGPETLRMKLWEILGNVSSPGKEFPSLKCVELHPDQDRDVKQSLIEKIYPNSDTIESDSQTHIFTRPMTRYLTRRKASGKKQSNKIEATKSIHGKESPQKRIFSFRGNCSGRLYDNYNDGSLNPKRNKILRMSSGFETHQGHRYENAEKKQQSEKSKSMAAAKKSMVRRNKVLNASSFNDKRNDVLVEPKKDTKDNTSFESPLNMMTDQKVAEQPMDVEVSKKNQPEDISDSLLKDKQNSVHDPSMPPEIKSCSCLPKGKQGKLHDQIPVKIFNTTGIRSFKSLLSSKSAGCKQNVQLEPSDGRHGKNDSQNDSQSNSLLVKPSVIMDEDGENRMSKSSTDEMDSESSEDESHKKGCRKSEELSPEICLSKNFLHSPNKNLGNSQDVEVTGRSSASDSSKGIQGNSELEMYLEQNHEDGLARAVALFTVALDRVKTKLKAISSRRSAEILQAAVEEIFLRLQNAESLIKKDMEKLTNLSHLKRKQLETRFQEQQEQLLGTYKRFKEEVDQHLQDYGGLFEDLEEHEIELKRSMERQRAAHKKLLAQVEHEISVQLDDTESRIMAAQELARKKMLQLKLGVTECLKHGAFG